MKQKKLQKKLVLETLVTLGILAVLGAVIYILSGLVEEMQSQENTQSVEIAKISVEKNALQSKYDNTKKNMDLYAEALLLRPDDSSATSRPIIQEKFKQYQKRFLLGDLRLAMVAPKELTDAKYKRSLMVMTASDLTINFDTLLDENVYALISLLQKELLAIPKITSLKMTRTEQVSDKVIQSVIREGTYPLIKTEIKSSLLSMKPPESIKTNKANAPTP